MKGFPGAIDYTTSKGGVINMTRSMAFEVAAQKIRVNCICPGIVDTDMYKNFIMASENPDALHKHLMQSHPLGRIGKPENIAYWRTLPRLERSQLDTGALLPIDGGFTAQ